MTAGRGVLHSELPYGADMVHCLQLWLNLPAAKKMVAPSYVDQRLVDTPVRQVDRGRIRVYAGKSGDLVHPHGSTWPMTLLDIELDSGASYVQEVGAGERTFLYVLDGGVRIGGDREADAQDVVWFQPEREAAESDAKISIAARTHLRAFLFSSPVIDEPAVAGGPFVMNTFDEISQAYEDLHTGRFVSKHPFAPD
jgi:redox-sensitive bicupin YhaK (pirin superfamily)